jgi:chemotaxis protein CheC
MNYDLSEIQKEALLELLNIGVNESTNILSEILNVEIDLQIPSIKIISADKLIEELQEVGKENYSAVNMEFRNSFSGVSQLVFSQDSANKLVDVFTRQVLGNGDFDEIKAGALIEIGNIILNTILATFSNALEHEFQFYVPVFFENYKKEFFEQREKYIGEVVLLGKTLFNIEQYHISGDIILYFNIKSFNYFVNLIDQYVKKIS